MFGKKEFEDYPIQSQPKLQSLLLGPLSTATVCPFCCSSIETDVVFHCTTRTHISAAKCAVVGCCLLPYFLKSGRDTIHYCPECKRYLGCYKK